MKLVFVHGSGESSMTFYYQMQYFTNSKSVDLPGHPKGQPCQSIEGYTEWLRGFLFASCYKDVVLCGHSMGGAIAQWYALNYPDELKGIVLIGTGARLKVHPRYIQQAEEAEADTSKWLHNRQSVLSKVDYQVGRILIRKAIEVGPTVQRSDLLCCDKFDLMERVHEIKVPTQVVCGTEDVMTPVKYAKYLAEKIEGSRTAILEGATHYVQLECPQQVNETIEGFVSTLS